MIYDVEKYFKLRFDSFSILKSINVQSSGCKNV